jgi:hypothetical protein
LECWQPSRQLRAPEVVLLLLLLLLCTLRAGRLLLG